jgi:flavin-binding protein dodecin
MSVLKVIELLASSTISWEDATKAITKASKSLKNIKSVYIKNQSAAVSDGKISEYRTTKSDI